MARENQVTREFHQALYQGDWLDGIILLIDGRACQKTFLPRIGSSSYSAGTPPVARVAEMYGRGVAEMYARNSVVAREMYSRNSVASEWVGGTLTVARVDGFDIRLSTTELSMGRRLPRMHTKTSMDLRFQPPVNQYVQSKYIRAGDVVCLLMVEEEAVRVTLWVTHIIEYTDAYILDLRKRKVITGHHSPS
jgi:hypothetical protein